MKKTDESVQPTVATDAAKAIGTPEPPSSDVDKTKIQSTDVLAPAGSPALPPRTGGRYVRLSLHDQGGMGRIWVAHDTSLDRDIILKELHPHLVENPAALTRFLREAQVTGQLEHPGIVPVYELARPEQGRSPFYTMRFVRGRTLSEAAQTYHQKLRAGHEDALGLAALLHAFVMVCNTVGFAHSRGILHRDLKGQNVVLGDFGEVVVLDWGLAKILGTSGSNRGPDEDVSDPGDDPRDDSASPNLTQQGQALGTPSSMSPEQAAGRLDQIDHRTDIYGLGTILYEILVGRPPFTGTSTVEVLKMVQDGEPAAPGSLRPDVPSVLEAICLRAMAKKPEDRFSSARDLAEAVQQWQETERRQAEAALRASEEKYRSLADAIPGIVWTARADGWIDYANQYWFRFTGLTMAQTEGTGWGAVVHPDDLPRVSDLWGKALQTGQPIEIDYRVKRAGDGAYRWFLAKASPVRDRDGPIVKWFGMLTEIDDQKRSERALEREIALVRLLHNVTKSAYEAATLEEVLQAGIDQVCAYTGWPIGHVYILEGQDELAPTSIWHLARPDFENFVRVTAATRLPVGTGLPGRVLAEQKPLWIMDVTQDTNFPRAPAAADAGIMGAFGFPVLTAAGVVAVLEFFTIEPQEPDEVLLRAMAQIGLQLGHVFDRKR